MWGNQWDFCGAKIKKGSADGNGVAVSCSDQTLKHSHHPIDEPDSIADQAQVNRPDACGSCGADRMWVHGHYRRWAMVSEQRVCIYVLRYRCPECGVTTSVLPGSCLPYRSLDAGMVILFIAYGGARAQAVPRYEEELRVYQRVWAGTFVAVVAALNWLPRTGNAAREVMGLLLGRWPQAGQAQETLLKCHGVSLLGHYRIHNWARKGVDPVSGCTRFDSS